MWIWQQDNWPNFTWNEGHIMSRLRKTRLTQGILLGKVAGQSNDQQRTMLDTLLANIVHSSAIEGEKLNAFSVRSSLANRLGFSEEHPFPTTPQTDGLAEIMLDAVQNVDTPLTLERILYHSALNRPCPHTSRITIGSFLRHVSLYLIQTKQLLSHSETNTKKRPRHHLVAQLVL